MHSGQLPGIPSQKLRFQLRRSKNAIFCHHPAIEYKIIKLLSSQIMLKWLPLNLVKLRLCWSGRVVSWSVITPPRESVIIPPLESSISVGAQIGTMGPTRVHGPIHCCSTGPLQPGPSPNKRPAGDAAADKTRPDGPHHSLRHCQPPSLPPSRLKHSQEHPGTSMKHQEALEPL